MNNTRNNSKMKNKEDRLLKTAGKNNLDPDSILNKRSGRDRRKGFDRRSRLDRRKGFDRRSARNH